MPPQPVQKGEKILTNINCTQKCNYQKDGKCACDSVVLPYLSDEDITNNECPYFCEPEERQQKTNLQR